MESVSEAAVDSILQEIPECLVDANYYYYKNFRNYYNIYHKKDRFEYYISIGSASQGPYYVATFAEHLLVTRVGVRTSINRRIIDSVSFEIAILAGNNPYDGNKRSTLDAYLKIPPSVSHYEPQYVREFQTNERLDTGKTVRHRVHPGHQLELSINSHPNVKFDNTDVFVRVQSSDIVGGPYDHPSWTGGYGSPTSGIKSYRKYQRYVQPFLPQYHIT